jgi:DNA-directed RNA polymerase specialized sigma24 family protein
MIAAASNFSPSGEVIDAIVRRIVGRKISRLRRAGVLRRQDAEDFEHELLLRVLASWSDFKPDQSNRYAFVGMVVERHTINLLRDRRAQKRDPERVEAFGADNRPDERKPDQPDLRMDVAAVINTLPEHLGLLAVLDAPSDKVEATQHKRQDTALPRLRQSGLR